MQNPINANNQITLTLKEITDLLNVRHDKAMDKVIKMAENPAFGMVSKMDTMVDRGFGGSQTIQTLVLNKRQSIAVASVLDVSLLMKVIDRLEELENQSSKTLHHASPTIAACEIATVAFDFMSKFMDDRNMIAISASQAAYKETGVDVVKNSGVQLLAYDQQQLFTPTQLGEQLGLSAIKTNKLLAEKSLQAKVSGSWTLTDMGREFGTYLDTGKKRSDGTPVRQIKWKESVVSELETPQKSQ